MPHEVIASVRVVLPEAPADMAGALGEIAEAWSNFLGAFDQYSASSEVTFSVNETRAKPGPKPQRKPRKFKIMPDGSAQFTEREQEEKTLPTLDDDVRGILLPEDAQP